MNQRTKALAITKRTKDIVYERDNHRCILCGSPYGAPNAHYISRGQGGLGIEQNVVTLCWDCHRAYDQSIAREEMGEEIKKYLQSKYPDWDEQKLYYRKWSE